MGEHIDRYEVVRELARGGAGRVLLARDPHLDRQVAIKLLLAGLGADERALERFRREALALARLSHPSIVQVYDAGVGQGGLPYLAMALVEGESLAARLERSGPLPPQEAARVARDLAMALAHAHEHGLVHRDVKPDNVLLAPDGQVRLTDFGLALDLEAKQARISLPGGLLGTIGYCAPEQVMGDSAAIGAPVDVHGLGATLYAALTGAPPFGGESQVEALVATLERPPPPLSPTTPAALQAVCARCLAKEPTARGSAQEAAAALSAWLERATRPARHGPSDRGDGAAVPLAAPTVGKPAAPGRRRAALVGLGAGITLLVLVGLVGLRRSPADPPPPAIAATPSAPPREAPPVQPARAGQAGRAQGSLRIAIRARVELDRPAAGAPAWSPNGEWFAVPVQGGSIQLFQARNPQGPRLTHTLPASQWNWWTLAFSPSGRRLAATDTMRLVVFHEPATPHAPAQREGGLGSCAPWFADDGRLEFVGSGRFMSFDLNTGRREWDAAMDRVLTSDPPDCVTTPDGRYLVVTLAHQGERRLTLYERLSGSAGQWRPGWRPVWSLRTSGQAGQPAVSPDGELTAWTEEKNLQAASGKAPELASWCPHVGGTAHVAVLPAAGRRGQGAPAVLTVSRPLHDRLHLAAWTARGELQVQTELTELAGHPVRYCLRPVPSPRGAQFLLAVSRSRSASLTTLLVVEVE